MKPEMYASKKRSSETMMGFVTSAPVVMHEEAPRPRHESHKMSSMKVKILECAVKVICHGPYPINVLANQAMKQLLEDLLGVESTDTPAYNTIKKHVDEFLARELQHRVSTLTVSFNILKKLFCCLTLDFTYRLF